ncbi:AraC family transcriptional regulator [Brevibacillus fortis]|uniref:AraC family transcriptional regulator n=1 Tax=Brevibacillus fortis TaxID=2126352 RepID=UPI002E1D27B9|nr:AraC family transcriptional regulator [Brevibacillus fortis]
MRLEDFALYWNYATIKIIDIRKQYQHGGEKLASYRLPTSGFIYSTKGSAQIYLDGMNVEVKPFSVLHAGKGTRLDIHLTTEEFSYYLILYKAVVSFPWPWRNDRVILREEASAFHRIYQLKPDNPLEMFDLVHQIYEEWQCTSQLQKFHVKALFHLFVYQILRQLHEQTGHTDKPDVVELVISHIHSHYQEPLTLDSLAQHFGYSAKNLSRLFKKQTGNSLIDFVIQVRIQKAKELLLHTEAPIQDIAEKIGYTDRLYFTRIFKKLTGTSPGHFRQRGAWEMDTENRPYRSRGLSIVMTGTRRYSNDDYENRYRYDGEEDSSMYSRKVPMVATLLFCFALVLSACTTSSTTTSTTGVGQAVQQTDTVENNNLTRKISTIKGEIEIPADPKRIIVDLYLGSFIALNVKPIGTPELNLKNPYFAEALAGVENIGEYENISLEKMLELQPDLIVTGNEAAYEQYKKIAPTVVVPFGELKNVHEEITFVGKLLGKEKEATAWLAEYDQRIASAREKVAKAVPADATFSIMQDWGKNTGVFGDNFGRGGQAVYSALGYKPPVGVAKEIMEQQSVEVSGEVLPTFAGDYIILTSEDRTLSDLQADPIWGTLDAVKNNRVYIWKKDKSWYFDPIATLSQTEELADWLVSTQKK